MKYRITGIVMALLIVAIAGIATSAEHEEGQDHRIHQHLTARKDLGCDCDHTELCSHLPLVLMETRGQKIPGEVTEKMDRFGERIYSKAEDGSDYINITVSVVDNLDRNNHPSDSPAFSTTSQCRIRGHASRHFEKKPYLLKFITEEGKDNDIPVMGMGKHNEWALNGPYQDKSLLRNYMWYNISGEIMEYAPNVRYCEVILDGEYQGLYLMVETITDGKDCRLNLSENVKGSQIAGYLVRQDRPIETSHRNFRDIYTFCERMEQVKQNISIKYPGKKNLTKEMVEEIEQEYSQFEKCLYSYDYDTEDYGYWNWIDVQNCVDYYLINEFVINTDSGKYSTYVYREIGGKYKWCVWDFNDSCDNGVDVKKDTEYFTMVSKPVFFMLTKDEKFINAVIKRYRELRKTVFSDEYLSDYIEETMDYLGPAIERNTKRWKTYIEEGNPLKPVERNVHSQREAADQLKSWLIKRGAWLDENIDALKAVSHFSRNKPYDH